MTARRVLGIAVAVGLVAAALAGLLAWKGAGEREAKRALAAEIEAAIAGRAPPAAAVPDLPLDAEVSRLYGEALGKLDPGFLADPAWGKVAGDRVPWTGDGPPVVRSALEANAAALALLDRAAAGDAPRRIEVRPPSWNAMKAAQEILRTRGRLGLARGEARTAVAAARTMKRFAEDLGTLPPGEAPGWITYVLWSGETQCRQVLEGVAAAPGPPDEAALREALAIARGRWIHLEWLARRRAEARLEVDRTFLALLGPGATQTMQSLGLRTRSMGDSLEGLFRPDTGSFDPGPEGPPSAAAVRRMRATFDDLFASLEARRGEDFVLGGRLDRAFSAEAGEGWRARRLGTGPMMGRLQWDAEGHRALLEAALGVRLFEARNGRLPRTPAEMVPAALPAIPVDPWTGRPVAIELTAEGWAVEAGPPAGKHDFGDGSSEERGALRLEGKPAGR